jgi:predicted nuclease of predicted toxin-antitoxin system
VRVLLDESLPRRLSRHFKGIEVETVFDRGWQGLKNGTLLERASSTFDVFFTADQNLRYQQNLTGFDIRVVVLAAFTNRLDDLSPLIPAALEAAKGMEPGEIRVIRHSPEGAS